MSPMLLTLAVAGATALPAEFPEPDRLAPNVAFWSQVYAVWKSDQVIFHDTDHPDIIYRVVDLGDLKVFPRPKDRAVRQQQYRDRQAFITKHLNEIGEGLDRLASRSLTAEVHLRKKSDQQLLEAFVRAGKSDQIRGARARLRWQYGLADRFASGLARFDAFRGVVEPIFESHGLPRELAALGFVESLFDPEVESFAGASGLFQLMPATATELGLTRSSLHDDRNDPRLAADAAARMLKGNYELLGSWPLALTGYNHGPNGVARAVEEVGSKDLVDLIDRYRGPTWGFASRNFYAEFLAARKVLSRRDELFGDWVPSPPWNPPVARTPVALNLTTVASKGCVSRKALQRYNPGLRTAAFHKDAQLPAGHPLNLPEGSNVAVFVACAASAMVPVVPDEPVDAGAVVEHEPGRVYQVQDGDTLWDISIRLGVPLSELQRLNGLTGGMIRPGDRLRLPD